METIADQISQQLVSLKLLPLTGDQVQCLIDPSRLEEAASMLADLQDRCGVRLPLPRGELIGGPFESETAAQEVALNFGTKFSVVTVDRMATDESRSTGVGDEFYITGYTGTDASLALTDIEQWVALWVRGEQRFISA